MSEQAKEKRGRKWWLWAAISGVAIVCLCSFIFALTGGTDDTSPAEVAGGVSPAGSAEELEPTASPQPTVAHSPLPTATVTFTPTITPTPTITLTPTPSVTPTATLEPRAITQTAQAIQRQATQAFEQNIRDIRKDCPAIDWVELSEVEYAKDHEGECVYIKGRISDLNFEEELIEVWIGFYSARIAVGIGNLNNTLGRLTDDTWINVYGHVCTTCWISTNRLDGSTTPIAGIDSILIEGPHGLIWVQE